MIITGHSDISNRRDLAQFVPLLSDRQEKCVDVARLNDKFSFSILFGRGTLALPLTSLFTQQRLLFRQLSSKFVLFLDYILLVAIRIDEWVRAPLFQ